MAKTILITGANGKVSSAIIPHLKNADVKIRALVRSAAKATGLGEGVEVVEGDLEKPPTLARAFEGVDTVWLLAPPGPRAPEQSSSALWAARQGGAKKVVRMSAVGAAHDAPTINSRLHALSDAEVMASGLEWTIIKPHAFMQNFFGSAKQIAEGTLYYAGADAKMGLVDVRDIAEFAARVLTTDGHKGERYTLTGPKSIDMNEVAAAFSKATGHPVKYIPVPVSAAQEGMAKAGMDPWFINSLGDYLTAYGRGWGDFATDDFPQLMGKPARSIDDFAQTFASAFGKK